MGSRSRKQDRLHSRRRIPPSNISPQCQKEHFVHGDYVGQSRAHLTSDDRLMLRRERTAERPIRHVVRLQVISLVAGGDDPGCKN